MIPQNMMLGNLIIKQNANLITKVQHQTWNQPVLLVSSVDPLKAMAYVMLVITVMGTGQ